MHHWLYHINSSVAVELLLKLHVAHKVVDGEKIYTLCVETVRKGDLDVHVEPFHESSSEVLTLELSNGEITLAPEKHGQTLLTMSAQVSFGKKPSAAGKGESEREREREATMLRTQPLF